MKAEMKFQFTELETIKALVDFYELNSVLYKDFEIRLIDGHFQISVKYEKDN